MPTTTINFKDKTFQTTDLPQQIQQTIAYYDIAVETQKEAETKLVLASSAAQQLLNVISAQVEQWENENTNAGLEDAYTDNTDTSIIEGNDTAPTK